MSSTGASAATAAASWGRQRLTTRVHALVSDPAQPGLDGGAGGLKTVAAEPIGAGQLVFQEGGPVSPAPGMHTVQCGEGCHVTLSGEGRYLAHSFAPNLRCRIWEHAVEGPAVDASASLPVEFLALRRIEAGETLSFDYTTTEWEVDVAFTDSETGRLMKGFRHLAPDEKAVLLGRGLVAPHILRLWLRDLLHGPASA